MNISLICNKKSYNFVLPLEASLSYIKKLCCRLYKCELLDIYYKGDKITKEENEEKILKNIITDGDSNIKLKIVINPTLSSTKNQTSSNTNSPANFNKNTDNIGNNIIINSDKILLFKDKTNKLFETIYEQKIKKLFNSIRDFNKKIIEINNFLFKKKPKYGKDEHLPNFEKKVYDFIDGLRLYFMKLITTLEMNDYAKYNYIVDNLNVFYNELILYDQLEKNSQKINTITSTPVNKFPINLKKSDNNFNLNSDKGNYFNKSSIKPSIKKVLLLNNNKNSLEAKSLLLSDKYNIKTENNKNEKSKFIKFASDESNKNEKQLKKEDKDEDNDDVNPEKSQEDSIDQSKDDSKKSKKNKNNIELDLNSSKKSQSNLSQKTINNISSITKKTVDSNKNLEKEEDNDNNKNNNSFHSQNSAKSDNVKSKQVVPFNFELIKSKNAQSENINLYEEIKLPKNALYNNNQKKNLKNENLNSTIQEMENENITNSSYDNSIGDKKKQNNTRKNSKRNTIKRNSLKKNSVNNSKKNVVKVNNNNKEVKMNTNNNKNISKLFGELSSTNNNNNNNRSNYDKARQSMRISPIKSLSLEKNSAVNLDRRKSLLNAIPIYHISSNNENDMAKALSRKAIMKKKKNKTLNKYDFLF